MRRYKITKQETNRDNLSANSDLNEIGIIEVQATDKKIDVAGVIREGDNNSFEKLVKANLRLVKLVAKNYQNQGLSLAYLINEGNFGLITAAERFDKTNGFSFIPFATWWIRQSILQAIKENSVIVMLPLNKIGSNNKIRTIFKKIEQEYQCEPTIDEIKEIMELFPEIV